MRMQERLAGWEAMQMQGKDGCSCTMHVARNVCEMICTLSKDTQEKKREERLKGVVGRAKHRDRDRG